MPQTARAARAISAGTSPPFVHAGSFGGGGGNGGGAIGDGGDEGGAVDDGHSVAYTDVAPVDLTLGELALQLKKGVWTVRNMQTGEQTEWPLDEAVSFVRSERERSNH